MAGQRAKGGKTHRKHGRNTKKPAHIRYWAENRLEKHKVRNLVRCNGMSEEQATVFWRSVRTKRKK